MPSGCLHAGEADDPELLSPRRCKPQNKRDKQSKVKDLGVHWRVAGVNLHERPMFKANEEKLEKTRDNCLKAMEMT